MELRHLRYFLVAGEELNFHRAAARLHVSVATISQQIIGLEKELGAALFGRLPRGLRLTAEGRSFLNDARQVMSAVEQAAEKVRRIARGQAGLLRLAINRTSSVHPVVHESIRAFHAAMPEVEIELVETPALRQLVAAIQSGEIDVSITYTPLRSHHDLEYRELHRGETRLALPAFHPLTKRRRITISDLKNESFVTARRTDWPHLHSILDSACRAHGFAPRIVQEVRTQQALFGVVAAGIGVALINPAQAANRPRGVVLKKVSDLAAPLPLDLVWSRGNHSMVAAKFIEIALGLADKGPKTTAKAPRQSTARAPSVTARLNRP